MGICKNRKHWKPEQAELGYDTYRGICTCSKWKYNSVNHDGSIRVLDRQNIQPDKPVTHLFENQNKEIPIGQANKSRYCFVTEYNFGCIHHSTKGNKKV